MAIKLAIIGIGLVGKGLLRALEGRPGFVVSALSNSKGYAYSEDGFSADDLAKAAAGKISELAQFRSGGSLEMALSCEYDILVELSATNIKDGEPAISHIRAALGRGKHVVTSNKGPLALRYGELASLASKNKVMLLHEAAVGGAIPVFATARDYLRGDRIRSVRGILNGTTNYILTRMGEDKLPFESALREAQQLGFAERDASYDVEGIDAAAKVAILGASIFGRDVSFKDVRRTGIRRVMPEMLELAALQNFRVKLICSVSEDGRMEVAPRLVPLSDPLAQIGGTLNAITLDCERAGPLTLVGKGAGDNETASAVLADLMRISLTM